MEGYTALAGGEEAPKSRCAQLRLFLGRHHPALFCWDASGRAFRKSDRRVLMLALLLWSLFFTALFPIFYMAAILMALGYDLVTDFRRDRRRAALIRSLSARSLYDSTNSVDESLVALK